MQGRLHHTHRQVQSVPLLTLPCKANRDLQHLIEDWAYEQDTGQVCALSRPLNILTIQLMRFQGQLRSRGEVGKLAHKIPLASKLQVPCSTEGVDARPCAYELQSVVYQSTTLVARLTQATIILSITAPKGEPNDTFARTSNGGCKQEPSIRPSMYRMMTYPRFAPVV